MIAPPLVDANGLSVYDGVREIERGEGAVGAAHEAVIHAVCVAVGPRDRPTRVDAGGLGECGARGIERTEGAGFGRGVCARGCVLCVGLQAS